MNDPVFTRTSGPLTMRCAVEVVIQAPPGIVWELLTDAAAFPRWNSTVSRIDGQIREGERLRLHVPGTKQTFTPTVSDVVAARRMTWSNGFNPVFKGVRTFDLDAGGDGSTTFVMKEQFSGLVFALTRRMLPDFQPIFETYAADLKREAEKIARERQR